MRNAVKDLRGRHGPRGTDPPPVWALAPPRFVVLLAGFLVAAVATPFSRQQIVVSVVGLSWVAATVTVAGRSREETGGSLSGWLAGPWVAAIDALLVLAAVAVSGGADSPLRWLLVGAPASWASARNPQIGVLGTLGAAGYLVASIGDLARGVPDTAATIAGFLAIYAGAVVIARATVRSQAREVALQAAVAHERAELDRRVIAQARAQQERLVLALHDGPLQLAVTVHQDLAELTAGEPIDLQQTSATLKDAIVQMRTLSSELYATVLRDSGLAAALQQIAGALQQRGGPPTVVDVGARAAGMHDELVLRIVRELLTNVLKHAGATGATVVVVMQGDPVRLMVVVSDDGVGLGDAARWRAAQDGHIGLTSIERHIEAAHGTLGFEQPLHGGTAVRVALPIPAVPPLAAR